MPSSRAVWSGFIQFSLVSVPVKAYTAAASGGGAAALNQLHRECNSRIQYKKTCPVHGEVAAGDIVSGYQFAKDQYVVVDVDELEKLRPKREKDISIAAFIKTDAIDPGMFSGKSYYLLPDGPVAHRPYTLLVRAMREQKRNAFAQVVMFGREQIVLLRPVGKVMMMSLLAYEAEMKDMAEFEADAPEVEVTAEELKLAKTLTDTLAEDDFDLSAYEDTYVARLNKLIEAKVQGKEIVAAPDQDASPRIINLMEALRKSVDEAKRKKPAKLTAPSPASKAAAARKRKTS